ncbi:MAG: LptF/LptG family permease [Myxococcales bacterium]
MRILWRHLAVDWLKAFAGTLAALTAIYLVVDYVDNARRYQGDDALRWILALYANKAVTVAYELLPGAMLLASGIVLAGLRKRNEWTALRALAIGPAHVFGPLAAAAALVAGLVIGTDEFTVAPASRRADEIHLDKFHYGGSWGAFFGEVRWFRGRRNIYHLRQGNAETGFQDVTLLTISEDFRLARRIDAKSMVPKGGQSWLLRDGTVRTLSGSASQVVHFVEREVLLDEDPAAFRVIKGRPEQLSWRDLVEQVELRRNVGLPTERWSMALHSKAAYPLAGVPGALLGCALTLRPGRRSYLTSALAEGFATVIGFWALLAVLKAAAMAGMVPPAVASWGPFVLMSLGALVAARWAR